MSSEKSATQPACPAARVAAPGEALEFLDGSLGIVPIAGPTNEILGRSFGWSMS